MSSFERGRTAAAICLTLCLLATQALAAPGGVAGERNRLLGEMTAKGQVLVNGAEAASGATVFPGSRLTTAKDSEAVVNLGEFGRVRLSPETASSINFGEQGLEGALDAGAVLVSKPEGVSALFTTKDVQVIPEKDSAAVFSVKVVGANTLVTAEAGRLELRSGNTSKLLNAGESATVGAQGGQGNDDDDEPDTDGLFWLGVAGFLGLTIGAIAYAVTNDDGGTPGNTNPIVISPLQ